MHASRLLVVVVFSVSLLGLAAYVMSGTPAVNVGSTTPTFERGRTLNVGCASATRGASVDQPRGREALEQLEPGDGRPE